MDINYHKYQHMDILFQNFQFDGLFNELISKINFNNTHLKYF